MDKHFAADIVGDGSDLIVGPFEAAMKRFYRGQVIPLVAGWFGEVNEDFDKLIKRVSWEASASEDGLRISPLVNYDLKGGAHQIMLRQFRRAICLSIVRGHARHKLGRLHCFRATAEEVAATCEANHSNNRWDPRQQGGSSWYQEHVPEGYGTFEQLFAMGTTSACLRGVQSCIIHFVCHCCDKYYTDTDKYI